MSLHTNARVPQRVEKEIVTYKVVQSTTDGLYTSDRNTPIPQVPYRLVAEGGPDIQEAHLATAKYRIGKGFIHSFSSYAPSIKEVYNNRFLGLFLIAKCHIPIGVSYFVGKDDDVYSTELIIDEVIKYYFPPCVLSLS